MINCKSCKHNGYTFNIQCKTCHNNSNFEKLITKMSQEHFITNISLAICQLENHEQIMQDVYDLIHVVKEESVEKEYDLIHEILCELGHFSVHVESDQFYIPNDWQYKGSPFKDEFPLKPTIKEAVHYATEQLEIEDET